MIYDIDYTWIIAIAILIGLSLLLTYLSEEQIDLTILLIYMTIVNAFIVATEFLPLWTEVLFLLITVSLAIIDLQSNKRSV